MRVQLRHITKLWSQTRPAHDSVVTGAAEMDFYVVWCDLVSLQVDKHPTRIMEFVQRVLIHLIPSKEADMGQET